LTSPVVARFKNDGALGKNPAPQNFMNNYKALAAFAQECCQASLDERAENPYLSWHSPDLSANTQAGDGTQIRYQETGMKFRPLQDRVVLRRVDQEEKTSGGIIIPDTAKEKPMQGEVIAVGPGARDESGKLQPLDVKAGDRVLFGKWSGTEVKIDGEELLIMKESDIMGIIEDAPAGKRKAA
jgi:chaperonin GroES